MVNTFKNSFKKKAEIRRQAESREKVAVFKNKLADIAADERKRKKVIAKEGALQAIIDKKIAASILAIPKPKDGKDGSDGADGKDGKNGKNGDDGLNGKSVKGNDGDDGRGIKTAHLNDAGHLIITYTDGKTKDVGKITQDMQIQPQTVAFGGGSQAPRTRPKGKVTDNAIARYDGKTGLVIQNSGILIEDNDVLTTPSGRIRNLTLEDNDYTLLTTDDRVEFTVTSLSLCTLPDPTGTLQEYKIINHYSSTKNVKFSRNINGDSDFQLIPNESLDIYSNGTEWMVD